MKRVAVVIKDPSMQYEGLRTSLGLLLEDAQVQMFVLNNKIAEMNEAYADNLSFLEEMDGEYFSNHTVNVEQYGFQYIGLNEIASKLAACDIVIPF
jgi:hypothetical protein